MSHQKPSKIPKPNKVKSYFTGSIASNFRNELSNSNNDLLSFCLRLIKPNSSIKKKKSTSVKDESKIKLPLLSNSKLLSIGPSKFTKTNSNASTEVKKYAVSVYANTNKFFENDYGGEFENNGYSIGIIYDFNPTNK